jgi:holliday junction DNA helicase RuvA
MIAYLQGKVVTCAPTYVILENGGIGYWVNITLQTYSQIQSFKEVKLHTYLHVTGGVQQPMTFSLFGFSDETERQLFIELLSISGIGASTVRMILSALSGEELIQAISTENEKILEAVKGVGPKTAKRIVLELKDKLSKGLKSGTQLSSLSNNARDEALSALVMLGFNRLNSEQALQKVFNENPKASVEDLIKLTLKRL